MQRQDFLINLDQLRKKDTLPLNQVVSSAFLDLDEKDIQFGDEINLRGEAYIVDERLILHLDVLVPVILTCSICNGEAPLNIEVNNLYHVEEIGPLKSPIFDFSTVLRQEILLEVPRFTECQNGNCPERETLKAYLGTKKS